MYKNEERTCEAFLLLNMQICDVLVTILSSLIGGLKKLHILFHPIFRKALPVFLRGLQTVAFGNWYVKLSLKYM